MFWYSNSHFPWLSMTQTKLRWLSMAWKTNFKNSMTFQVFHEPYEPCNNRLQTVLKAHANGRNTCILANIWISEIRTFPPFWPSERRRHELPLRERFLWGPKACLPPPPPHENFWIFFVSRIAKNAPNLLTLIKSVHRFQQIDRTLRRCVYSYAWFRTRFASIK